MRALPLAACLVVAACTPPATPVVETVTPASPTPSSVARTEAPAATRAPPPTPAPSPEAPAPTTTSPPAPTVAPTPTPSPTPTPAPPTPTTPAPAPTVARPAYLTIALQDVRSGERFALGGFPGKVTIVQAMAVW